MTRAQLVKHIRERLKNEYELEVSKEVINAVLSSEEEEVYMAVAENDEIKYSWGTIYGISKPPVRVAGKFSEIKSIKDNYGYSTWKNGYPQVKWSSVMKVYEIRPPEEYFESKEVRYTTEAREFRKAAGLPEIEEYKDFPEEKILEYCAKADEVRFSKLNSREKANKRRDNKHNRLKVKAMHEYWKRTNYTPMGADITWTGKQLDTVDCYLAAKLPEVTSPVDKLEIVRCARDIGEWKNEAQNHPELDELEAQFKKEIEEQGLTEIPHVKREYDGNTFTLKYKGQENPWGVLNVSSSVELARLRRERAEREFQEMLNNNSEKDEKE